MKNLLLPCLLLFFAGCKSEREFTDVKKLSEYKNTDFVATPQSKLPNGKNAVYCTTLLLAWQQIRDLAGKPLKINAAYPSLLELNQSESYQNTLNKEEYEAAVDIDPETGLVTAQTEFSKSLPFESKLRGFNNDLKFNGKIVPAFGKKDYHDTYEAVRILYYGNDNDFVVKLIPADKEHEIILCMTEKKPETLEDLFKLITEKTEAGNLEKKSADNYWKFYLDNEGDELLIPKINFNIETNYKDIEGNKFTAGQQLFVIEKAWQRTAFLLDETGAKIESEAEMTTTTAEAAITEKKPHPKKLHFNKPFLVMLKRVDSPNPYFAMWVENTELMVKN